MNIPKIKLSFWQIINMNVGFGIQYSFGLQSAVNPIYDFACKP
jgi:maltose/moltooligosaccharide transporter